MNIAICPKAVTASESSQRMRTLSAQLSTGHQPDPRMTRSLPTYPSDE